jgi:hypothetical protein
MISENGEGGGRELGSTGINEFFTLWVEHKIGNNTDVCPTGTQIVFWRNSGIQWIGKWI